MKRGGSGLSEADAGDWPKLAEALEANADELLYLADQVSPEVVDVIHQNPLAIPNFLRSAINLSPEQWVLLQQKVD
mgnify:CR=1 FL=1